MIPPASSHPLGPKTYAAGCPPPPPRPNGHGRHPAAAPQSRPRVWAPHEPRQKSGSRINRNPPHGTRRTPRISPPCATEFLRSGLIKSTDIDHFKSFMAIFCPFLRVFSFSAVFMLFFALFCCFLAIFSWFIHKFTPPTPRLMAQRQRNPPCLLVLPTDRWLPAAGPLPPSCLLDFLRSALGNRNPSTPGVAGSRHGCD